MILWFVVITSVTALLSSTALAQEATGFAGFAWGTPHALVKAELAKGQCRWGTTQKMLRGYDRIICTDYQLSGVGLAYLTLDFVGGALSGYRIAVPRELGSALRVAVPDILATPARAVSGTSRRTWTTSTHMSELMCVPGSVCLTVTASPASTPGGTTLPDHAAKHRGREPAAPVSVVPSGQGGGSSGPPR